MDAMQLITVGMAVVAVLAVLAAAYRRHSRHVRTTRPMPMIEVGDADVAQRLIIHHANSFSTRTSMSLAVDFDAGHPRTESVTSAPYGPLWRALRSNLTANILHPSRIGQLLLPIQRDAVDVLVAELSRSAGEVVAVRDGVYAAVFATMVRLCLGGGDGDGLGEREIGAMRRELRRFFHSGVDSRLLARSRVARLVHWRQWRYLVGTRRRLAELFGPVIAARRQSRRSSVDGGGICNSYLESLFDVRVPSNNGDAGPAGGESVSIRRPLRDDEIVRLVWEFLGSSTEATAACVEWTLARLVTEPEVQKKLFNELAAAGDPRKGQVSDERLQDSPYLRAVVLESLRLHPPLPLVVREVGPEGAATAGAAPPPDGTLVRFLFNAAEIGREAWTDPDKFRPERFLAGGEGEGVSPVPGPKEIRMMPFGAGRRHCPGAGLAIIHVGCLVAALVREFEWAPPADGGGVDLTVVDAMFVKVMASPLRARIIPRK